MNEGLVVVVRAFIGFFSLLIFARVLGKQQISQLTFFDYVLGITIGSTASTLTTDLSSSAWSHWVGLFSWVVFGYLMERITMKWSKVAKYLDGDPIIVIVRGKILEAALKKTKYRASDVLQLLRNKDIFDLDQVQYGIIEPNGEISVMKKPEYQTLTPKDMNKTVSKAELKIELIYDGIIIDENLEYFNKNRKWLVHQLNKQKIKDESEVFLATLDDLGNFYVDKYDDCMKGDLKSKVPKEPC